MPSQLNRLAVPALAKGLHFVVKPCNPRRSLLFKKIAILAVPRSPCPQNMLLMTVQASSMAPAVPGRRVGAAVPGPRRVAIISGPTGGRRCHRYGTLIKRRPRVRSSRSRFGSSSGTPRPGAARELQFKSHFKGEAKFYCGHCEAFVARNWQIARRVLRPGFEKAPITTNYKTTTTRRATAVITDNWQ
jgi:hypothetical protein